MTRLIKRLILCLSCLACGNALAIDPNDEDLSYLPAEMLHHLTESRFGYDEAEFKRCMSANRKAEQDADAQKKLVESCRIRTTPRKCRGLSHKPSEKVSKSAQEICAESCKAKGKHSGGCALN